jgi:DNA-binding MarR family transcriptional regulator
MSASPDECAREILELVPQVMRAIRIEMRRQRASDLSIPQFRMLAFLSHNEGASLSDAAEHIGLSLPSMSKLVDGLVARQLVTREPSSEDRRRVTLALTEAGQIAFQAARKLTQACLAEQLAALPPADRATVIRAMQILRPIFNSTGDRKQTNQWLPKHENHRQPV